MELKKNLYTCKIWSSSINLKSLKSWLLLLPSPCFYTGLSTKKQRFTLICSPLGNKKSKDQFERREYRNFYIFTSDKPDKILAFLDILRYSAGIKLKIVLTFESHSINV